MGSIFSELFNNWVNAFYQEEGKKKPIHLPKEKQLSFTLPVQKKYCTATRLIK